MTRNQMIAGGVLVAVAVLLYLLIFRPKPVPPGPPSEIAMLVDVAEHMCLSNTSSEKRATIGAKLDAIKGLSVSAGAGTNDTETRGAIAALSDQLKTEQDDKIRACMQPYTDKMLSLVH